ncbi:MAG TPA: NAD(P)(+) transhydrogenase (Re/Si-specific) subunit beta [Candidatus Anammoximicrobium sp.]|nr:NAD(P)(+) transhydrogenase (Re/Si-specific) subunit beta [Candidatus Anammoximicrobium sp.]
MNTTTLNVLVQLSYVLAAVLFIFGLKMMSHPRTAVRGNLLGSLGMLIAIVATLLLHEVVTYEYILAGVLIGSIAGAWLALKVPMTAMPQMVGLLNGFGGGASVLVAGAELLRGGVGEVNPYVAMIATAASGIIGAVTFWGSLVAFGKLQELKTFKKPFSLPGQQAINVVLLLVSLALSAWLVVAEPGLAPWIYLAIVVVTSVLGVFLVNPIGGADMPVVIALLNSYSGLAACATGFVINNSVLIIAGSLVGASGIILSNIMCKAMNRSLTNVLFGVMEAGSLAGSADEFYATVRSTTADDIAMLLDGVQRVVFVPGYGMAVAQAQHAVRDLGKIIEDRGGHVEYAIHPVAGRMPGHMNVLLAEADVDYEQLKEMDQINPTMETVDVAIVIGANDVVNPLAKTDPNSPIAGMPIIDVDKARTVVVIKRSLSPGFAGIPNPLFGAPNTLMYFADGQKAILDIVRAVKEL